MTDLVGGHTGRIFCVGFDATKVRVLSPLIGVHALLTVIVTARLYRAVKTRSVALTPLCDAPYAHERHRKSVSGTLRMGWTRPTSPLRGILDLGIALGVVHILLWTNITLALYCRLHLL